MRDVGRDPPCSPVLVQRNPSIHLPIWAERPESEQSKLGSLTFPAKKATVGASKNPHVTDLVCFWWRLRVSDDPNLRRFL